MQSTARHVAKAGKSNERGRAAREISRDDVLVGAVQTDFRLLSRLFVVAVGVVTAAAVAVVCTPRRPLTRLTGFP